MRVAKVTVPAQVAQKTSLLIMRVIVKVTLIPTLMRTTTKSTIIVILTISNNI